MQQTSIFKPLMILTGTAILLVVMHLAADFLVPILLAGFFAMLLTPVHRWLKRKHIPGGVALLLTMFLLVVIVGFLVVLVGNSMATLAKDLEQYNDQFSQRQAELESWLQSYSQSVDLSQVPSAANPSTLTGIMSGFLSTLREILKDGVIILIVIVFVLAEGPLFIQRLINSFGADHFLPQSLVSLAGMGGESLAGGGCPEQREGDMRRENRRTAAGRPAHRGLRGARRSSDEEVRSVPFSGART